MSTRDEMIVQAMRSGISREDASILTDVSKHAFEEAMNTAQRIVGTIQDDDLRIAAYASVLASFATVMRDVLPEHWRAFAAAEISTSESTVIILPKQGEHLAK